MDLSNLKDGNMKQCQLSGLLTMMNNKPFFPIIKFNFLADNFEIPIFDRSIKLFWFPFQADDACLHCHATTDDSTGDAAMGDDMPQRVAMMPQRAAMMPQRAGHDASTGDHDASMGGHDASTGSQDASTGGHDVAVPQRRRL